MVGDDEAQLVVDGRHILGGAVHRALRGGRDEDRLAAEAWLPLDRRIGEDFAGDDAARERVVGEELDVAVFRRGHSRLRGHGLS